MTDSEIFLRLLLSFICGTVVGLERQWHHKNAGLKTNTLVAVGATAFTIVAELGLGSAYLPQVAGGVVTGIGFIGGGVIMKRGGSVQGVNSAATLWTTASIGLAIGRGYEKLALLVLGFVVIIQFVERGLAKRIDRRSNFVSPDISYTLEIAFELSATDSVREMWRSFSSKPGVSVLHYLETRTNDSGILLSASMRLSETRCGELTPITQNLSSQLGVRRAEWSQRSRLEDDRE